MIHKKISINAILCAIYLGFFFLTHGPELWFWRPFALAWLGLVTVASSAAYVTLLVYPGRAVEIQPSVYCYLCRKERPCNGIHCPMCNKCVADFREHSRVLGTCISDSQWYVYLILMILLFILNVSVSLFGWIHVLETINSSQKHKSATVGLLVVSFGCISGLAVCFPPRFHHSGLIGKSAVIFVSGWTTLAAYTKIPILNITLTAISLSLIPFQATAVTPLVMQLINTLKSHVKK